MRSGTLVRLAIVAVLAVALINDLGHIAAPYYEIDGNASAVALQAAFRYRQNQSRRQALAEAQRVAADLEVELIGFDIREGQARVWIRSRPSGTVIAHRIPSLWAKLVAESYSSAAVF